MKIGRILCLDPYRQNPFFSLFSGKNVTFFPFTLKFSTFHEISSIFLDFFYFYNLSKKFGPVPQGWPVSKGCLVCIAWFEVKTKPDWSLTWRSLSRPFNPLLSTPFEEADEGGGGCEGGGKWSPPIPLASEWSPPPPLEELLCGCWCWRPFEPFMWLRLSWLKRKGLCHLCNLVGFLSNRQFWIFVI